MGPFPHDAPPAEIGPDNPAGLDGFAFVAFAHPDPAEFDTLFGRMGYTAVARHRSKAITLWRQGDVDYLVDAEPGSHASRFADAHGPSAPAMGWYVADARHAHDHALARGAESYTGDDKALDVPAIVGIGGSLIYFVERPRDGEQAPVPRAAAPTDTAAVGTSPYDAAFDWLGERDPRPTGVGFHYLDHLTHNVHRGRMDHWWDFYRETFGFRQIHFFDIEGKLTGLTSRAITSPCGKIRIPLNESTDDRSQIETYLKAYKGEGIQHVAVGTDDIYGGADRLAANGLAFMPGPPATYYARSVERVSGHDEPLDRLARHGILIDGEGVVDGGTTRILLQIFSKTVIGPIFFEFIQRKGDEGFGEGNFRALFESIEEEQIRSGELAADPTLAKVVTST